MHGSINFPILNGYVTWPLITPKYRLNMFENRALRRLFGPKGEEVRGGVRKLYKQEIRDLYSASVVIRVNKEQETRRAVHGVHMGEKKNTHRIIVRKPESQNPLGRSRQR
jgi:hypothetical protein